MWPSSRFAVSLKPNVAYRSLNLCAGRKKQTTLPSLAYAGIPYQVRGESSDALALTMAWIRLAISRSAFGISAIFASTSLSPPADFSSLARSRIAARSSAVNPFFADFFSAIGKHLRGQPELGDDEAVADVEFGQGQQRAVAAVPGAIGEIAREPSDTVGHEPTVEQGEGRHVRPYGLVEIRGRPAPVGGGEAVRAIGGHGHRLDRDGAQRLELDQPGIAGAGEPGKVVVEPTERHIRVVREDDGAPPQDAADLGECRGTIGPVMGGEDCERRVDALVRQRWRLSDTADRQRERCRSLPDHQLGRFDGDDREIGWLVGARAGADVHDGRGLAEHRPNDPRDPRVGAARGGVCAADSVVEKVLDGR